MKSRTPVVVEAHHFSADDIIGGDAALDFVNTVTGRDESPRDWLDSYERLLEWATLVQLLPETNLRALRRRLRNEPAVAARALAQVKVLREALFALLNSIISGNVPPRNAVALLREHWVRGIEAHDLRFTDGRLVTELRADAVDFDLVGSIVACRMIEHVLPSPLDRLRICQGTNCSWVFIDSSKAGRRRWCDMSVCGNAAKSRRFYARARRRRNPRH
jgi:predicted RNA-binding Zn ribbon-like protein